MQTLSEFLNLITGIWGMSDYQGAAHTLKYKVLLSLWEGHLAQLLFFNTKFYLLAPCLETSNSG